MYRITPEYSTGANREPECLPSWNNRVESAFFLAAGVGAIAILANGEVWMLHFAFEEG